MAVLLTGPSRPAPHRVLKRRIGPLSAQGLGVISAFEHHLQGLGTLSAGTRRAYLTDTRHFACWIEAELDTPVFSPEHLPPPLLTRYLTHLGQLPLSPASINRALAGLRRFCAWAKLSGLAPDDPARSVAFVRLLAPSPAAPPRRLNDHEEAALTRSVARHGSPRDQAIVALMLHAGLWAAEACQLRWRDLTLGDASGCLRVTGQNYRRREIPLNGVARQALRNLHPVLPDPAARLFSSARQGKALSVRAVGHLISKYARLAVLDISPHDLRHRFGYEMAERLPLHRVAQLMGHASLDTTALYLCAPDLQRESEKTAWL
jgi:integrase/recombinase XerD